MSEAEIIGICLLTVFFIFSFPFVALTFGIWSIPWIIIALYVVMKLMDESIKKDIN